MVMWTMLCAIFAGLSGRVETRIRWRLTHTAFAWLTAWFDVTTALAVTDTRPALGEWWKLQKLGARARRHFERTDKGEAAACPCNRLVELDELPPGQITLRSRSRVARAVHGGWDVHRGGPDRRRRSPGTRPLCHPRTRRPPHCRDGGVARFAAHDAGWRHCEMCSRRASLGLTANLVGSRSSA
jgi:hypothetical protein